MRWRLRLSEFDFEVRYKKGKLNTQADALSRLQSLGETTEELDQDLPCFVIEDIYESEESNVDDEFFHLDHDNILATMDPTSDSELLEPISVEELLTEQQKDHFCTNLRSHLNGGEDLSFALGEKGVSFRLVDAVPQVLVPETLKRRILHLSHHAKLAGHPGGAKLNRTLRRHFYWLPIDCHQTVRTCIECVKNRIRLRRNSKRMTLFPAKAPLEFISIDIMGELIRSKRDNFPPLVITERFSQLVRTIAMKTIRAKTIAKAFVEHWIFVYGTPIWVLSDNGPQFAAKFFQDVCRILGAKNLFTSTYHPQCNGKVERFNRTMLAALRTYVADHPRDWDFFTDAITFAYNTYVHRSTKVAPFDLELSRPQPTLNLKIEPGIVTTINAKQFPNRWKKWLKGLISAAKTEMDKTQQRYKRNFDKSVRLPAQDLQKGRFVFFYDRTTKGPLPAKILSDTSWHRSFLDLSRLLT